MLEQYKGIIDSKSVVNFLVKIYLHYLNKNIVLETNVPTCKLVVRQDVAVFKEGDQISIISPECGDCPAAVSNRRATTTDDNSICHIYRFNLPYLRKAKF